MAEGGSIVLTEGEIAIDEEGAIFVDEEEQGRLRVVTFPETERLVKEGETLFTWTGTTSEVRPVEQSDIRQGYLESSNVNTMREMVQMIETIRTYEAQQKVIQAFDSTEKKAVDEVGRLR